MAAPSTASNAPEIRRFRNHQNEWVDTFLVTAWPAERRGVTSRSAEVRCDAEGWLYLVYVWLDGHGGPAVMEAVHENGLPENNAQLLLIKLAQTIAQLNRVAQ